MATFRDCGGQWGFHYPHIQLFQEIWRVLKPNGIFESVTPIKEPGLHGRPTHVSVWNAETFQQFTRRGIDFQRGHMKSYGFTGEFKIMSSQDYGAQHLQVIMKAVK
jgi:SAM-dependent methyltransferase